MNTIRLRKMTAASLLASIAVVLVILYHTPIFPSASFLEYDAADIPIVMGAVILGPVWGLLITFTVSAIQAIFISPQSGLYGFLMHVIATGVLAVTASFVARRIRAGRDLFWLVFSSVTGTITATAAMVAANMLITPYFTGWPASAVAAILIPVIIPFNLIKLGLNSVAAVLIIKALPAYLTSGDTLGIYSRSKKRI